MPTYSSNEYPPEGEEEQHLSVKLDPECYSYKNQLSEFMEPDSVVEVFNRMLQYAMSHCTYHKIDFMQEHERLERLVNIYTKKYVRHLLHKMVRYAKENQTVNQEYTNGNLEKLNMFNMVPKDDEDAYDEWYANEVDDRVKK